MGLHRKGLGQLNTEQLADAILKELDGPSCVSGYRTMWHTLRIKYGIVVPRREVQKLLKELDPTGTEERKRRRLKRRNYTSSGPNQCWHIDGYDKLKPFGFAIHGAIDGYSRHVLWLKVGRTNNNPSVIAQYYLQCIKELGGCPRQLRTDPGTENGVMAGMQCYLRADGEDDLAGQRAHSYGASTANQRIECWWSYLRRNRTSWWINFFKDLCDDGVLVRGTILHDECLWFCFSSIIQHDLEFVKLHWNTHRIRPSRFETVPGKPEELFFLSEEFGGENQMQPLDEAKVEELQEHLHSDDNVESNDYQEYFEYIIESQGLMRPTNWRDALSLFRYLVRIAV